MKTASSPSSSSSTAAPARPGWRLLSRTAAAIFGGYAVASAAAVFLAAILPLAPAESTLAATLLSFGVYTGVALWAFAEQDLRRVWRWLLAAATVLAGVGWLLARILGGGA